ncbi:hypothetical protein [Streptomyces hokutonensis]|uniref:hypothetical protein n=1 Tax=Streptomyces hokutonensis TaxID=1306990 RepID=UPI0033C05F49
MATAVAAPNIAFAVQNGDGGGGGSDGSSSEDSSRDDDAQSLVDEHGDGKGNPQLTLDNAYRSLDGAPEGTRARVMPKENKLESKPKAERKSKNDGKVYNPDLEYLDQQGDIVGYGEVKTIGEASEKKFAEQLDSAVKQLRWRQDWKGGTEVNEIFIQVPDLADPPEIKSWVRSYQDTRRGGVKSISGYRLRVYSTNGNSLGTFDLGANADEGYVEDHTYHSSNGFSY